MAKKLVTGRVVGFVLVIDPKGKRERFVFYNPELLANKLQEIRVADREHGRVGGGKYNPTKFVASIQFRRDDDGEMFEQEGLDPTGFIQVESVAYLSRCSCGQTTWIVFPDEEFRYMVTGEYVCSECVSMSSLSR